MDAIAATAIAVVWPRKLFTVEERTGGQRHTGTTIPLRTSLSSFVVPMNLPLNLSLHKHGIYD